MILFFILLLLIFVFFLYYLKIAIKFYDYFEEVSILKDILCYPLKNGNIYIVRLKTFNNKYTKQRDFIALKPAIKEYFYKQGFECITEDIDKLKFKRKNQF